MSAIARIVTVTLLTLLTSESAWAYVGPGAGLSLLVAFWALLTAILASLGFLIMWPLRRRLRRVKNASAAEHGKADTRSKDG